MADSERPLVRKRNFHPFPGSWASSISSCRQHPQPVPHLGFVQRPLAGRKHLMLFPARRQQINHERHPTRRQRLPADPGQLPRPVPNTAASAGTSTRTTRRALASATPTGPSTPTRRTKQTLQNASQYTDPKSGEP